MNEECTVCGQFIGGPHGTESMAHGSCDFTEGDARCVFGPGHAARYHHLTDGRNVFSSGLLTGRAAESA